LKLTLLIITNFICQAVLCGKRANAEAATAQEKALHGELCKLMASQIDLSIDLAKGRRKEYSADMTTPTECLFCQY